MDFLWYYGLYLLACSSRQGSCPPGLQGVWAMDGVMPDGTSRFSIGKDKIHHYMGCSTFSHHTVLPEIALAKIREDAPFDKVCYIGCGVTTGIGAVINTAKVEPGAKCIVFGLGGIGLNVIQGLRLVGASMIIGVDINNARKQWGERFGMTHFVNPKEVGGDLVQHLVALTDGGADYSFECVGMEPCMTSGKPGSSFWISLNTSRRRAWLPLNLNAPWLVPMATARESQPERSTNSRERAGSHSSASVSATRTWSSTPDTVPSSPSTVMSPTP